ncbi:hypothetical protein CYLTODRAFT_410731 [Cylindrobasidium torrendii FP15055 ss-10]|uniref:Uncharacterized protein n=1 Tax=Cylindrobasidium torrendii FP15055 ss-10 TaxID=1314674 RepID=A0A0D7BEJ1_9AGAR|nr:hypothetical protein CYLTODRAFT_410731 [Cylindrobasidium torrendii FP15055 ss-10]
MNPSQTTRGYVSSTTGQPTTHDIHRTSNILPRKKSNAQFDRSVDAMAAPPVPLNVQLNRVVEYGKDVRPSSHKTVGTVSTGQQPGSNSSGKSSGNPPESDARLKKKPSCAKLLKKKSSQFLDKVKAAASGQTPPLPNTTPRK